MINSNSKQTTGLKRFTSNIAVVFGVGLALFGAVLIIAITLLQQDRTTVAPTAPESRPQAAEFTSSTCSLTFNALEATGDPQIGASCKQQVFRDELDNTPGFYSLRKTLQTAKAGEQIVWVVEVTNTSTAEKTLTLTEQIPATSMTFVDSDCGATAFNNGVVTCVFENVLPGKTGRKHIRAKLLDSLALNTVVTGAGSLKSATSPASLTCNASVSIAQVSDQKQCNQPCESDKECSETAGHVCYQTNAGFFCRLGTNPENTTCSGPTPTPTTAPLACNQQCSTNAQCSTGFCYQPPMPTCAPGMNCIQAFPPKVCRNQTNPTSITCANPTPTPTATPSPTPTPTPTPVILACNQQCSSNAQCATGFCYQPPMPTCPPGLNCIQAFPPRVCRSQANPTSVTCAGFTPLPTSSPTPTPTSVATATPTPSATPLAGCNAACTRNADCANTSHICVELDGQRICRLASNVNSTTCSEPGATSTATPVASVQPGLPAAGNESRTVIAVLAVGAVVLIMGALAFLLLL